MRGGLAEIVLFAQCVGTKYGLESEVLQRIACEEDNAKEGGTGVTSREELVLTGGKLHTPICKVHTVAGWNHFARDPRVFMLGPAYTASDDAKQFCQMECQCSIMIGVPFTVAKRGQDASGKSCPRFIHRLWL